MTMLSPEAVRVFRRDFEVLHVQNVTRLDEESQILVSRYKPALKQLQVIWALSVALPLIIITGFSLSSSLVSLAAIIVYLFVSFVVTYLQMFLFSGKQQLPDQPLSLFLKEEAVRFCKAHLRDYIKILLTILRNTFLDVLITMLVLYIAGAVLMSALFGFGSFPSFFTLSPVDVLIHQTRNLLLFGAVIAGVIRFAVLMERYLFVDRLYIQNVIEQKNLTHTDIIEESNTLTQVLSYRLAYLYVWIRPLFFWNYGASVYFYSLFLLIQLEKNKLQEVRIQ